MVIRYQIKLLKKIELKFLDCVPVGKILALDTSLGVGIFKRAIKGTFKLERLHELYYELHNIKTNKFEDIIKLETIARITEVNIMNFDQQFNDFVPEVIASSTKNKRCSNCEQQDVCFRTSFD